MPWHADAPSSTGELPDDPFRDLDWMQDTPDEQPAQPSPTFQTSWLSEAMLPEAQEAQLPTSTFQTDWLSESSAAAAPSESELGDLFAAEPSAVPDNWPPDLDAAGNQLESAPVPDWIADLELSAAPAAPAESDLPDWLSEAPALEGQAPLQASEAVPEWLQEASSESAAAELDVPEWLRMDVPEPTGQAPSAPPAQPAPTDLPAWMLELAPEPTTPPGGLMGKGAASDDMAWLDQFDFEAPAGPKPAEIPKPSRGVSLSAASDEGLGDLDIDAILGAAPDFDVPEPSLPPINLDEEFDFDALPELPPAPSAQPEPPAAPAAASLAPAVPQPPSKATSEAPAVAELPEWVAEMRPDSTPTLRIGDQEITLQERPLSALPEAMLALRERLKSLPSAPPADPNQDSPLSGIPEVLQPLPLAAEPTPLAPSSALATAAQLAGVQTLRRIVAAQEAILKQRETADISAPAHLKPRARLKFDRLLLTIFLAAIVVLPFFTNLAELAPLPRLAELDTEAQARLSAIGDAIERLPSGGSALVAFEYAPNAAGEMDDLARALLRDLLKRGVRPVILSTNPAAVRHAYNLLYRLSRDSAEMSWLGRRDPLQARRDYTVLGYLPNGLSGVRALANALYDGSLQQQALFSTDLEGLPSGIALAQLPDLRTNPIFILAQRQEDVQTWVEQFRPPPNAPPEAGLRMVIAAAAAATITVQTYAAAEPQRIIGTLSGIRDGLLYRELRAQYADPKAQRQAEQRWQSVSLAAFAAALAILIGAALSMVQFLAQRRRAQ